jgi:1-acyl-sn-glycerol-3-phosphate acyltransferase
LERRAHPDERAAFREGHPVPVILARRTGPVLRGSALARAVLGLFGWKVVFDGLPSAQGVAVVWPHTSNWDFPIGILTKWTIGFPFVFWGKDTLFRVPVFGAWLRWLGGMPVDRSSPQGVVGQMAGRLRLAREQGEFMWLALSPEGTRGLVDGWRSGFYQVAVQADVPVAVAFFDYARRECGVAAFLQLSGDRGLDIAAIEKLLHDKRGRRHEQASPIRFR